MYVCKGVGVHTHACVVYVFLRLEGVPLIGLSSPCLCPVLLHFPPT